MDQPMMSQGQPPMYQEQGQPPMYQEQGQPGMTQGQGQPMMSPHPSQQPMMQQQNGNPIVVMMPMQMGQYFGSDPQRMTCPYCQADQMTYVIYQMGLFTWILVVLVACTSFGLLAWVPCFWDRCKDVEHHCSNCQRVVGIYKRI